MHEMILMWMKTLQLAITSSFQQVGSRIMTLRKAQPTERCDFPTWFKGPKHWHALMGNAGYVFHPSDGSMHILKQTGYMETRALCEQINKQTTNEMQAVVHYTTGW